MQGAHRVCDCIFPHACAPWHGSECCWNICNLPYMLHRYSAVSKFGTPPSNHGVLRLLCIDVYPAIW